MKQIFIILFLVIISARISSAEKRKILFLGNSYTYYNDLPNTLKQLALSLGDTLEVDSYTPGGASFQSLSNDANTLAKIQLPGWDYVVLQAQSQEPAFSPAQVQSDTYPFAKKLDSLIHISNPCAETIFYMTWGRKNGDAGNCAAYPPICTYEGMQQRLRESYLEMSNTNHATCSPVGVAWRTFRVAHPAVELYNPDESHPSVNGTYLAACTFYCSIYHKTTLGANYVLAGVAAADAPICLYTDVDFPYTTNSIMDLLQQLTSAQFDIAAGVKNKNYYKHVPPFRRFISKLLRACTGFVLRLKVADTQCGLKGFNEKGKELFLSTTIDRYLFDLEFIFLASRNNTIDIKPVEIELKENIQFSSMRAGILFTEAGNFLKIFFKSL